MGVSRTARGAGRNLHWLLADLSQRQIATRLAAKTPARWPPPDLSEALFNIPRQGYLALMGGGD
jgi:hypothetical protein